MDIVTGSYNPGNLYVFRGKGGGEYEAGQILKDEAGKEIAIESASAPAVIDWNGDGKPDLIVGFISGKAKLLINRGGMVFGKPQDVLVGGKPLSGANLGPCVADWDSDGVPDLLVGDGQGVVTFYKGSKAAEGYTFAAGVELVGPKTFPNKEDRPGSRAKLSVADWNGDGKLDLIVGDFFSQQDPPKNLTAAQQRRLKQLRLEQAKLMPEMSKLTAPIMERVKKRLGYEPTAKTDREKVSAFYKAYSAELQKDKAYSQLMRRYSAIYREMAPMQGAYTNGGCVRVYLRK